MHRYLRLIFVLASMIGKTSHKSGEYDSDNESVNSFPETWKSVASVISNRASPLAEEMVVLQTEEVTNDVDINSSNHVSNIECFTVHTTPAIIEAITSEQFEDKFAKVDRNLIEGNKQLCEDTFHEQNNIPHSSDEATVTLDEQYPVSEGAIDAASINSVTPTQNSLARFKPRNNNLTRTGTAVSVNSYIVIPVYKRLDTISDAVSVTSTVYTKYNEITCKIVHMREAMKILKMKDNQISFWTIFHYYSRKQNSPEGINKLRKEIAKSYLHGLKILQSSESYLNDVALSKLSNQLNQAEDGDVMGSSTADDAFSLHSNMISNLGNEEESVSPVVLTVDEKKKLRVVVDRIMMASLPTNGGSGTAIKLPSPVYNSATSDKCNILSPVMIVQLIKDFGLVGLFQNESSAGKCISKSDLIRINRIINTMLANTVSNENAHKSTGSLDTFFDNGANDSVDGSRKMDMPVLPLAVLTTFVNFVTFQKVYFCCLVQISYCDEMCMIYAIDIIAIDY